jgi:heterodisulfide reductase subunit B
MDCCGQALDRVGEREGALAFGRRKLTDVQSHEADALVVVCPSCFQQFDLNQAALQRAKEDINVPVFYLAELVALAYGHEPDEIGLSMHRVSVEPFLNKWVTRAGDKEALAEHFDVSLLAKCYSCQACKDDCPVCKVDQAFEPTEMIARLLRGELEEVVDEGQAWKCLECFTCQELCHSDIGMAETFRKLKEIAAVAGQGPESVSAAYEEFLRSGVLGKPRESARKKLGLEPLPDRGGESLARVLAGEEGDEE